MTTNQIYNTLIKLLQRRGYKCSRCEPLVGKTESDKIVDSEGNEFVQHLWQTIHYFKETVGMKDDIKIIERVFMIVKKGLDTEKYGETFEDFYDKFKDKIE
jgi:hypothetical protein